MRFCVVGGGIAGLACAYELQRAGHDVVLYEKEERVGGRMASRVKDGFIFDIGADHLCDWYTEMKKYCGEFGIGWEKMRFLEYGILQNKRITSRDDAAGFWGKFRLAAQYFFTPVVDEDFFDLSKLAEYDTENGYDFMVRRVGRRAADYLVDPFASTYQFHRATEISKGALFGILHSLRTHKERWDLYRTQGGMQALPDAFAQRLQVKSGYAVTSVEYRGDHVVVDNTETFDAVVMATTATTTLQLYKNPTPAQKNLLQQARYSASISVAFRVPASLLPQISIVWVPYVESEKISGYVNEKMKGGEVVQGDDALLSTWLHEDFARSIMDRSDEEICTLVKEDLLQVCPWFTSLEQLKNHDLQRWPEAMPKFYTGYLRQVKTFLESSQGEQKVYFCGDYINSLWTEGSLRGGARTAAHILSAIPKRAQLGS